MVIIVDGISDQIIFDQYECNENCGEFEYWDQIRYPPFFNGFSLS